MSVKFQSGKTNIGRDYQVCACCVMDTTDSFISFDEKGVCMRCREFEERIEPGWNYGNGHEEELNKLLSDIKISGKGKKYDCILGLSGGLDSSYLLHMTVKHWGLRPFVFHIDTGWNLPVAENNIKRMTDKLGVELHVIKMDWDEMREMQLAWFRTGLEAVDTPQDHAFIALIDRYACRLGIKYIFNGYNISTEIVADPASWGEEWEQTGDGTFVKDVNKKYCRIPIKKYVYTNGFKHKFWIPYVLGVKTVKPLNLIQITQKEMLKTLQEEYGYEEYGQKHFESLITKFIEGYWMPARFGHDIRRAQLSSLVITKQMSRDEALRILEKPPISEEEGKLLFAEVAAKMGVSEEELMTYQKMPKRTEQFRNHAWIYNLGIKIYELLGIEKRIRK